MVRICKILQEAFSQVDQGRYGHSASARQSAMDGPASHHYAVEFPDGQMVLLTRLCEGQRATVLQLPATAAVAKEPARSQVGERSRLA